MKNYAQIDEVLYHVGFAAHALEGATLAVLPGDPGRVEPLAQALGKEPHFIATHREYTSWLTYIGTRPVLVCSTGMGGPSVAICLEELARMGITHVIRVGTTGTIQESVALGDVIIDKASVRLDGTSQHYAPLEFPAVASFTVTQALVEAAKAAAAPYHLGIAASSDTFWPGQERYDRLCAAQVSGHDARMAGAGRAELRDGNVGSVRDGAGLGLARRRCLWRSREAYR